MMKFKVILILLFATTVSANDHVSNFKLSQFIKKNEGYSRTVYVDTRGNLTVGYGHKLSKKYYKEGQWIDTSQIYLWFRSDLNTAKRCARRFLYNDYNENEFIVATDMAFNMGCTGLYKFSKLRKHLKNNDYVMAAKAIRHSNYYNQVTNRAIKNIRLITKLTN